MKERPIIMAAESIGAIEGNRKSQTRRVMKPQPPCVDAVRRLAGIDYRLSNTDPPPASVWRTMGPVWAVRDLTDGRHDWKCPYGQPGDLLWVRETWGSIEADHPLCKDGRKPQPGDRVVYRANPADDYQWGSGLPSQGSFCWRPSIFMPKWACRLWLRVTNVRVERVQEISEADVEAEGAFDGTGLHSFDCSGPFEECCGHESPQEMFSRLWDSINAKRSYGWDVNPWIWVVTFERVEAPA
jgi:hypothetical protein